MPEIRVLEGKRFVHAICREMTAKNHVCGVHMGIVEVSRPNTTIVRCRACKKMEAWDVDDEQKITVSVIPQSARVKIYDDPIIIRERRDG